MIGKIALFYILRLVNYIIPKKNILLFTSSPNYYDNALCVFQYLMNKKKKYKIVWLLENNNIKNKLNNVIYIERHSFKGLYYFFRSKYIFHTHGLYLNATTKQQIVFSLWHGMPLKRIQYLFPKDLTNIANRKLNINITIATSDLMAEIVSRCFNCDISKVKVVGLPRNDYLFDKLKFKNIPEDQKVIVWMPTYRDGNNRKEGLQYEFGLPIVNSKNYSEINEWCSKNNICIIIKFHPYQKINNILSGLSNIKIVSEDIVDEQKHFYSYLGSADALITDYSSVYIDYLTIDKPIGFILEDYAKYTDDRGFVFDNPLEYMPGVHIYNIEELKNFIEEIAHNVDSSKNLRNTIGIKLNKFRDNKNTKRFVTEILPVLLGEKIK